MEKKDEGESRDCYPDLRHTNVSDLCPPNSVLHLGPSLIIRPGSIPKRPQPHTPSASAITQSS